MYIYIYIYVYIYIYIIKKHTYLCRYLGTVAVDGAGGLARGPTEARPEPVVPLHPLRPTKPHVNSNTLKQRSQPRSASRGSDLGNVLLQPLPGVDRSALSSLLHSHEILE